MPTTKYNENSILRRQEILSYKKRYRDVLLRIKNIKDSDSGRVLSDLYVLIVANAENRVYNTLGTDSTDPIAELANCKYNIGIKNGAKLVLDSFVNVDEELDRVLSQIATIEQDIKNIQETIGD